MKKHAYYFIYILILIFNCQFFKLNAQQSESTLQEKHFNAASDYFHGIAEFQYNNLEVSLQYFNKTIASNPKFYEALNSRAECYFKMNQFDKSVTDFLAAFNINKNMYSMNFIYALINADKKEEAYLYLGSYLINSKNKSTYKYRKELFEKDKKLSCLHKDDRWKQILKKKYIEPTFQTVKPDSNIVDFKFYEQYNLLQSEINKKSLTYLEYYYKDNSVVIDGPNSKLAKQVFDLVNESRTNPIEFLTKYKSNIEKHNANYCEVLLKSKPIAKLKWDEGLEKMAKEIVINGNLNPTYQGVNKMGGSTQSGSNNTQINLDPFYYICFMYSIINNYDYLYFAIYFNPEMKTGYADFYGKTDTPTKISYTFNEVVDISSVDFDKLNTAKDAAYMSDVEKKMVLEINFARTYPKIYSKFVLKFLSDKSASIWKLNQIEYDTGMELIDELNNLTPLSILTPIECIYNASKLHGEDCKSRGFFDHKGSNQSNSFDRISKQCPFMKSTGENGSGGNEANPRDHVIGLLIDEGNTGRGHRTTIINKDWLFVGCYRYNDARYGYYWVQNFGY